VHGLPASVGRLADYTIFGAAPGPRAGWAAVPLWYREPYEMMRGHSRAATVEEGRACQQFFDAVAEVARLQAIKLYRLRVATPYPIPVLPCLDHEARLHENPAPHAAAYIEDLDSRGLHEIVVIPARRRIEIDVVSTAEEHSAEAHARLVAWLAGRFPDFTVRISGPSLLRGDRRVARACRAQIKLRDVLSSADVDALAWSINQLQTIGALMEKESRVASWSVRTVTGPLLALAGFLSYRVLEGLTPVIGATWVPWLQYAAVGGLGAVFLYLGLKAVHLTEMANRVWKRASEYEMILAERKRLAGGLRVAAPREIAAVARAEPIIRESPATGRRPG